MPSRDVATKSWVGALLCAFLVLSCGGDGDDDGTKPPTDYPPVVASCIEIPATVTIPSANADAQAAKLAVQGHLKMVADSSQAPFEFFDTLTGLPWDKSGDCWHMDLTSQGCSVESAVCKLAGGEHEWTVTLSGAGCDQSGTTYDGWTATRAFTTARTGRFTVYRPATDVAMETLTWECSEDSRSQTWSYFAGTPADDRLLRTISADDLEGGSMDVDYTEPQIRRVATHLGPGSSPTSGWMETAVAEGATYRRTSRVEWNADGTGASITYDESGQETAHKTW